MSQTAMPIRNFKGQLCISIYQFQILEIRNN